MAKKQVIAEFRCRECKTDNRKTVSIDTDNELPGLNMRRRRVVDVECGKCGMTNAVEVND
jgi:hypothetical protein